MDDIDIDTTGIFVRGGAIIPMKMDVKGSVKEMEEVPLTLFVYPDSKGNAELTLYIDDGRSMAYANDNSAAYAIWNVKLVNYGSLKITRVEGTYDGVNTKKGALPVLDVVLFGKGEYSTIKVNGETVQGTNMQGVLTKIPLAAEVEPEKGLEINCEN